MIEDLPIRLKGAASAIAPFFDASRDFPRTRFSVAESFRPLSLIPREEPMGVTVLHAGLPDLDPKEAGRFLRPHWPAARILIGCPGAVPPDDGLYDERPPLTEPGTAVRAALERVTENFRRGKIA